MIDNDSIISKVNTQILNILGDELPILTKMKNYVVESGGKRVRSLIASYLDAIFQDGGSEVYRIAAIVEVIHAASLLHDDVLDDADIRRGKPSGKKIFGSKEVILGGDYMFATAIRALNSYENPALMDRFTRVIRDLSIGELYQLEYEGRQDIPLENYLKIIYYKTGSLFETACEAVGISNSRQSDEIRQCAEMGKNLGMLFQMRDDYLDYYGSHLLQKQPYQDFENGLMTYPVLLAREKMDNSAREKLGSYFRMSIEERKNEKIIKTFLELMELYDAKSLCIQNFKAMEQKLIGQIRSFPEHVFRQKIENQVTKLMDFT